MANLNITIAHKLSRDEATSRIKKLLENIRTEHADIISNVQENWNGNKGTFSFTAVIIDISGSITVESNNIIITGRVPFGKEKIEEVIRAKADELLK